MKTRPWTWTLPRRLTTWIIMSIPRSAPLTSNSSPSAGADTEFQDNEVFGGATPPPPIFHPNDLVNRARNQLGELWDDGLDILTQMLAQELQHLSEREEDPCAQHVLRTRVGCQVPSAWHGTRSCVATKVDTMASRPLVARPSCSPPT